MSNEPEVAGAKTRYVVLTVPSVSRLTESAFPPVKDVATFERPVTVLFDDNAARAAPSYTALPSESVAVTVTIICSPGVYDALSVVIVTLLTDDPVVTLTGVAVMYAVEVVIAGFTTRTVMSDV